MFPHAKARFSEPSVAGRDEALDGHPQPADGVPQLVSQVLPLQLPLADAQLMSETRTVSGMVVNVHRQDSQSAVCEKIGNISYSRQ